MPAPATAEWTRHSAVRSGKTHRRPSFRATLASVVAIDRGNPSSRLRRRSFPPSDHFPIGEAIHGRVVRPIGEGVAALVGLIVTAARAYFGRRTGGAGAMAPDTP